jgi:hypothetical protein
MAVAVVVAVGVAVVLAEGGRMVASGCCQGGGVGGEGLGKGRREGGGQGSRKGSGMGGLHFLLIINESSF